MIRKAAKVIFISVGFIIVSIFTVVIVGTIIFEPGPSNGDLNAKSVIYATYKGKYTISFSMFGLYISLKPTSARSIDEEEAIEIAKLFFFHDYSKKILRKTDYIFLNVYRRKNIIFGYSIYDFDYQIFYNKNGEYFERREVEAY